MLDTDIDRALKVGGRQFCAEEHEAAYVYLQSHHLHRYPTLTLLACAVSHLLPLFFDLRNESAKMQ